jgi:NADH dehydrogenase
MAEFDIPGSSARGRVLITGANGHLGCRLLARLAATHPVRAIVRSERAKAKIVALPEASQIETRVIDYLDVASMSEAAIDCEYVVHLVGIIKETASATYAQAHEQTTACLIDALKSSGVKRVIYISILGSRSDSANTCLASKGRAERLLLDAEVPALILKVPMVLGEGDFASQALKQKASSRFNLVFRAASKEQPIYAGDVIEAIVAGITHQHLDDQMLELAGPESMSRKRLIQRAARLRDNDNSVSVISLPIAFGMGMAYLAERLVANPPVTRAMLDVLDHDDEIDVTKACKLLDIGLTDLDETLKLCIANDRG